MTESSEVDPPVSDEVHNSIGWRLGYICVGLTTLLLIALAVPSFMACGCSPRLKSEAQQYVGSMSRAQQAYYLHRGKFAHPLQYLDLGLGFYFPTETFSYRYRIALGVKVGKNHYQFVSQQKGPFQHRNGKIFPPQLTAPNSADVLLITGEPKKLGLKSYAGLVFVGRSTCSVEPITSVVLWESNQSLVTSIPKRLIVPSDIDFCNSSEINKKIPTPKGFRQL